MNALKFGFPGCIFCFKSFAEVARSREHIIPRNILGHWITDGVCIECNSRLGHIADPGIFRDGRVVRAIEELDLPKLHRLIADNSDYVIEFPEKSVRAKSKKGVVKLPPTTIGHSLVVDDADLRKKLTEILSKAEPVGSGLDASEHVDRLVLAIQVEHKEEFTDQATGLTLKNKPAIQRSSIQLDEGAVKRAVCKIFYETAFHFMDPKHIINNRSALRALAGAAMGYPEDDAILCFPPAERSPISPASGGAQYHHQIICHFRGHSTLMDLFLFGVAGFRTVLSPASPNESGPMTSEQRPLDMMSLVFTFEPGDPRKTYVFWRYVGETVPHQIQVD